MPVQRLRNAHVVHKPRQEDTQSTHARLNELWRVAANELLLRQAREQDTDVAAAQRLAQPHEVAAQYVHGAELAGGDSHERVPEQDSTDVAATAGGRTCSGAVRWSQAGPCALGTSWCCGQSLWTTTEGRSPGVGDQHQPLRSVSLCTSCQHSARLGTVLSR